MSLKRTVAGLLLGATLTGGAVTVAAVAMPTLAGAADEVAVAEAVPQADEGGRAGHLRAMLQHRRGEAAEKVAAFLGMSATELREELRAGKSLSQIASEHGKSREELVTAMNDAVAARLDEAVEAGKISEEKAATAKAKAAERIEKLVDRTRGDRARTEGSAG